MPPAQWFVQHSCEIFVIFEYFVACLCHQYQITSSADHILIKYPEYPLPKYCHTQVHLFDHPNCKNGQPGNTGLQADKRNKNITSQNKTQLCQCQSESSFSKSDFFIGSVSDLDVTLCFDIWEVVSYTCKRHLFVGDDPWECEGGGLNQKKTWSTFFTKPIVILLSGAKF